MSPKRLECPPELREMILNAGPLPDVLGTAMAELMGTPLAIDFETYYDDECSATVTSYRGYVTHPRFYAWLVAIEGEGFSYCGPVEDFDWSQLDGMEAWAHNAAFDQAVYERLVEQGKIPGGIAGWHCTADLCAANGYPRSLAAASKQVLGVEMDKAPRDLMKGRTGEEMLDGPDRDMFLEYARLDAVYCSQIAAKLRWPNATESKLSRANRDMVHGGIALDVAYVREAVESMERQMAECVAQVDWVGKPCPSGRMDLKGWQLTPGALVTNRLISHCNAHGWVPPAEVGQPVPKEWLLKHRDELAQGVPVIADMGSRYAVSDYCERMGVPEPKTRAKNEDAWNDWLEDYGEQAPALKALSLHGRIQRQAAVYKRMLGNQVKGIFYYDKLYHGAHSGRFSAVGGINTENLDSEPKFGFFLRNALIPRPGHVFLCSDYDQIEPRVLAWLIGDAPFIEMVKQGISPYIIHGVLTKRIAEADVPQFVDESKRTPEQQKLYKALKMEVLLLGYGGGGEKYAEASGLGLTVPQAKRVVDDFRRGRPLIPEFWNSLERDFYRAFEPGEKYEIVLPSGRRLHYWNCQRRKVKKSWGTVWAYTAETVKGGRRVKPRDSVKNVYGGLLCENVVQATARDVLAHAVTVLMDAYREGRTPVRPLLTVHDELLCECPADSVEEGTRHLLNVMNSRPPWAAGLPVAAGVKVLERYEK